MGADAYARCPRCWSKNEKARLEIIKMLEEAYAKVTAKEYDRLLSENPVISTDDTETVREDYEQGILNDGTYYVNFRAQCQNKGCDFKHKFEHSEELK